MRKKKIVFAVAVGLVALELVLQLGALVLSLVYRAPSAGSTRADVVCLGDSYTAGIGASSPEASYPAQLEQRLRAQGHDVHVRNGGMPGQDSAFMLQRLPSLLQPETKVLCVLMAFNDTWSRPARVDLAAIPPATDPAGFQWRWRTGRLVALCLRFAENSWFRTGEQVGDAAMPRADAKPEELADVDAGFRQLDALGLTAAGEPPPVLPIEPDAGVAGQLAAIERQITTGAAREALAAATTLADDPRAGVFAWKLVAIAAHAAGDQARAGAAFARLAELAAGGERAAVEAQLIALLATGRADEAITAARSLVAKEPRSLAGWIVLQDATYALGRTAEFRDVAPRAMRVIGRLLPPQVAAMARHFAEVTAAEEPVRAARLLVAACLLDGNAALARAKIAALRPNVPWLHFAAALDGADGADPERRERWRTLLRAAYDEDAGTAPWAATLADHLLQIGALCRDRGIRLVVIGYPFPHPQLEAVQRAAAERLAVPFVFVRERFDRELATRKWDELFVQNGHCNDAGYEIVAEMAATAVASALAK